MQTVIHIGQHKTGTTSIQSCLKTNWELLEKNGIYVPNQILGSASPSHYLLNVYSLGENRFSSMKDELLSSNGADYLDWLDQNLPAEIERIYKTAALKKCDRVIWSNEGLYLLNSVAEYKKLVSIFASYSSHISVVCCFREKASFRKSYRNQLKRQHISPVNKQDSYRYIQKDSWLFDYQRKKSLLGSVFDQCLYFDYNPGNNTRAFLDILDIDIPCEEERLNVSPAESSLKRLLKATVGFRK